MSIVDKGMNIVAKTAISRLRVAEEVMKVTGIRGYTPETFVENAETISISPNKYLDLAKVIRFIELSRGRRDKEVYAYRKAFNIEDNVPDSDIKIKIRSLKQSRLWAKIMDSLSMNLYVIFANDRLNVLEKALDKALDDETSDRYRTEYMKIFLEHTKKPDSKSNLEISVNIENNYLEDKLDKIAKKLEDMDGNKIIEVIGNGKA